MYLTVALWRGITAVVNSSRLTRNHVKAGRLLGVYNGTYEYCYRLRVARGP